jgi:hypothetical protein
MTQRRVENKSTVAHGEGDMALPAIDVLAGRRAAG